MKIIVIVLLSLGVAGGSYYYYHHNYVHTLMLSEVVGHSEDNLTNIVVNFMDFDTGLTRHDIHRLKSSSEYWCKRMNDVDSIQDLQLKAKENEKLLAEMMEDPTMKKIFKGTFAATSAFIRQLLKN